MERSVTQSAAEIFPPTQELKRRADAELMASTQPQNHSGAHTCLHTRILYTSLLSEGETLRNVLRSKDKHSFPGQCSNLLRIQTLDRDVMLFLQKSVSMSCIVILRGK